MAPLIGITAANFVSPTTGWLYNRAYVGCIQAIADAGGLPVLIPENLDEPTRRGIYDRLDGILLPGGADIRPDRYGDDCHPATAGIDDARDLTEIQLTQWAVADNRPLLGICRGQQLLNVALGGTLIQDIPSQIKTTINHDTEPRNHLTHAVQIHPDSRLAAILGTTQVAVNSLHHQSVAHPAPDVQVTAYAPDGVIEALELPEKRFILSVQWHPEDLYREYPVMCRLFRAFVEAANSAP